jgi:DNA repair protein RadD
VQGEIFQQFETAAIELRPYQIQGKAQLRDAYRRGARRVIYQLPTGGGKTVVFADLSASAVSKGNSVLVLVHRQELVKQAHAKLAMAGVPAGIISEGTVTNADLSVQVASVQTLIRRLDCARQFNLIVVDECHHALGDTYRTIFEHQKSAKLLGVSATPSRLDGRGLGEVFDAIVCGPSIKELTALGYLCPSRLFTADRSVDLRGVGSKGGDYNSGELVAALRTAMITGDAVAQYRAHADRLPAIAFCVTVEHAEEVAQQFRNAGYRSACVHGGTPKQERDALIAGLGSGDVDVLTSCDLISEGLDVPGVAAVILLRPTLSLTLYMQQIGRGLRPAPGKAELIVLDHVGNLKRHGLPDAERAWTLDGIVQPSEQVKQQKGKGNGAGTGAQRDWSSAPGTLIEISKSRAAEFGAPIRQYPRGEWTDEQLRAYARKKGYKPGWVFYRKRARQAQARRRAS